MRKIILLLLVTILTLPAMLFAQGRVISGNVRDAGGILPGASVIEKGVANNGTVADANGRFTLTLKGTSNVVTATFIGYNKLDVNVSGKSNNIDITLTSSQQGLDEVIVVGYGKTTRITNTGAVSSIAAADVRTVPTANIQNTLQGKLPGFFSQQSSGQPGKDASDFFIRGVSSLNANGNKPLIIVDDIEYTYDQLQQINVNEIETISILKDASTTAIYGVKGANGVLVVTTRRGKAGRPQVNVRVEGGLQSPTRVPKFLNSYESAVLINQATKNDNATATLPFTQADLNAFQNGTDPYGHPDVSWYDAIFNKLTYQANTNIDISGGTDNLKYFISGGALDQNGLLKSFPDPRGQINNNYYFDRYNFRSNLDLKANKTLTLRLDVTTRFSNLNQPNVGSASALSDIYDFRIMTPFTAPFLNPDGSYAYAFSPYNTAHLPTVNARIATSGYSNAKRSDYNVLFNGTQKLDAITDGLSVTGRVAYASSEQYTRGAGTYGNSIPSFHYDPVTQTTTKNPTAPYVLGNQYYIGDINVYQTNVNLQGFANYDRSFGKHHVTGLFLFNQSSQTFYTGVGSDRVGVPVKFQGISMRGTYEYAQKYLIDINVARNGSDRFAAANRFKFLPAISLGYNIANESFFKDIFKNVGLLKIRGSYGLVGSDVAPGNQYIYTQNYLQGGGYVFGSSAQGISTYYEGALANGSVSWEKQRELDLGVDINMLKDNALSITFDYFHNVRYDQLIFPNSIPEVLGVGLPAINLGRTQNNGFDGSVGYHTNIGKVSFGSNFVFSYAKNKVLEKSEALPAYPWLARTGQPIDQPFGYHFVGYYTAADAAAINAYKASHQNSNLGNSVPAPNAASPIQAGDLRYDDLNHDGIIDESDQRPIGMPNLATTSLGLTLQFGYKGFSASVLFQGNFNYSFIITGTGIEPFQSQFQPIHQQAWTPANADNAQFPRLTQIAGTVNSPSSYPSDYWLVNAYYVRLKTIDLGYQLPTKMLPFHINNARIYVSAYNLFTWDNSLKYQQDPEIRSNTAGDAYINQRVINLGVQLGF